MIKENIKINNLCKVFGDKSILKNVNVSFFPGEVIGILGANGSGKTTLIKILCGLIHPDQGMVYIRGTDLFKARLEAMSSIGVLLEGPRSLYWRLSIWENFKYFSGLKGVFGKPMQSQGENLLKKFDLWSIKHQMVESLSLGMKQKLAICCSLSHDPEIILLDEPTISMDAKSRQSLMELIGSYKKNSKTIIISSHENEILSQLCVRQIELHNGRLLEQSA